MTARIPIRPQPDPTQISRSERKSVANIFWLSFTVRLTAMCLIHFSGLERTMSLTKDSRLYRETGEIMADFFRTNGQSPWPARVTGVVDGLYEWMLGVTFYFTDDSLFVGRLLSVIAGSLIPLVVWRTARFFLDRGTSLRCMLWSAFFPTQLYYSTLLVRDSHSTLAMCLIFMGLAALTSNAPAKWCLSLPAGLILTAGFRAYMFSILLGLIPAAIVLSFIVGTARNKSRSLQRVLVIGIVITACMAGFGFQELIYHRDSSNIFDLNFLNHVRDNLNRGTGALYGDGGEVSEIGNSITETVEALARGAYFFFFSVDPLTGMGSIRQFMALPEVIIVVVMIAPMFRGLKRIKRHHLFQCFSLLLIALAVTFAYSSVATNGGPLMRWRLQVVNVYIIVAAIGWTKQYQPLAMRRRKRPRGTRHPSSRGSSSAFKVPGQQVGYG